MRKPFLLTWVYLLVVVLVLSACVTDRTGSDTDADEIVSTVGDPEDQKDADSDAEQDLQSVETGGQVTPQTSPVPSAALPGAGTIVEVSRGNTVGPGIPLSRLENVSLSKRLSGLLDNSWPHDVEDYTQGIIAAGRTFIINERYRDEIFAGIRIGTPFDKIRTTLGSPGWETESILLYRGQNYYIMFQGNNEVHYAVIMTSPQMLNDRYALQSIVKELNSGNEASLEKLLPKMDPTGAFFDSTGFITGGGYYAHSQYGVVIIDIDEKYIEIYNNYEGQLYDWTGGAPVYEVRFIDRDMNVDTMLIELNSYLEIEELFRNQGVTSPDGKLCAVYEWIYSMDHHFIIRTLDHSIQDRKIYAATSSDFYWLTNSHLVFIDTYNELPYAVDVNFSNPSAINLLYEAGIITERDAEFGKYKFEILSVENGRLSLKDVLNNTTNTLTVWEGPHGLTVKSN